MDWATLCVALADCSDVLVSVSEESATESAVFWIILVIERMFSSILFVWSAIWANSSPESVARWTRKSPCATLLKPESTMSTDAEMVRSRKKPQTQVSTMATMATMMVVMMTRS